MSKDEILKELERRLEFTKKTFITGGLPNPSKTFKDFVNNEVEFLNALIEIVKSSSTTGFKDFDGKDIKEGDTLGWVTVRGDNKHKKEIVHYDKECGSWYCGSDLLSTVLWEQNNDEWKASQHHEIKEKQYASIIEVTK